jgi:hypothetical protein
MPDTLEERDWTRLLGRIKEGNCTPFIGAGACAPRLPLGADIARAWADAQDYPLEDRHDLARVAQYWGVRERDGMVPKEAFAKYFRDLKEAPDFEKDLDEPHAVLAQLPLPVYITTNYDDFMMRALKAKMKDPKREICRWNDYVKKQVKSEFDRRPPFDPTPANPVVFHLHGHAERPESLVLTEDDYFDLLAQISKDRGPIPLRIQRALSGASLLFVGYRLADWDFRVLFRSLVLASFRRSHIAVQIAPAGDPRRAVEAIKYLDRYFDKLDVRVYWGDAREFAHDLRVRWQELGRAT